MKQCLTNKNTKEELFQKSFLMKINYKIAIKIRLYKHLFIIFQVIYLNQAKTTWLAKKIHKLNQTIKNLKKFSKIYLYKI